MFVFLQVPKLVVDPIVKVKGNLPMEVSVKCRLAFRRNAIFINLRLVVLSCLPKSTYFLTEQQNGTAYTLTFSLQISSRNFT
jgi:hypothetical protein